MANSRRIKNNATSSQFMNGEDIDGRPISGANSRSRRPGLFVQCLHRHERCLEKQIIDACLEC